MALTLKMQAPANGVGPVIPGNLMPSGSAYVIDANGQINANSLDIGFLLGLGFLGLGIQGAANANTPLSGSEVVEIIQNGQIVQTPVSNIGGGGGGLNNPFPDAGPTAPAIFGTDTGSGPFFQTTTGLPGIASGGVARVTWDSSGNTNVLNGNLNVTRTGGIGPSLFVSQTTGSTSPSIALQQQAAGSNVELDANGDGSANIAASNNNGAFIITVNIDGTSSLAGITLTAAGTTGQLYIDPITHALSVSP